MFAALIPIAAQILGPVIQKVIGSVTSDLTQSNKAESDNQKKSSDSNKNFLEQQTQGLFSGLASKALGSILGGFGGMKA